jgi:methionine-rich copper-binding protein CopC
MKKILLLIMIGLAGMGYPVAASAHAFPERSEPAVGSVLQNSPETVTIWFDSFLEPLFSTITVYDKNRNQVDKKDTHLKETDPSGLSVSLPPLAPGVYHLFWHVVSRDGHTTEGDFRFTLRQTP